MAFVTVVTKLLYAFDDVERHPRNLQEPAAQTIDWARWMKMHANEDEPEEARAKHHNVDHWKTTKDDALAMTGEQIDDYLDWYQRTWVKKDVEAEGPQKELLDLFPLRHVTSGTTGKKREQDYENEITEKLIRSQSFLVNVQPITDEEAEVYEEGVARPGSFYKGWRTIDDLSQSGRAFVDIAADTIGVNVDTLLQGVSQIERTLLRWKDNERRKEAFPDQDDNGLDENAGDIDGEAVYGNVGTTMEDVAGMSID